MRAKTIVLALALLGGALLTAQASEARVVKVLPHLLDAQGRHTLSPSLYDRDAYQAYLRAHRTLVAARRFDIQWKAPRSLEGPLRLRLELRNGKDSPDKPLVLEQTLGPKRKSGGWTGITLEGESFRQFGELVSWRATLWQGEQQLAEQNSFLW